LIVFEDEANAGHGDSLLVLTAERGADVTNLPRYVITGKWTGTKVLFIKARKKLTGQQGGARDI
jgi:hypothetical protein